MKKLLRLLFIAIIFQSAAAFAQDPAAPKTPIRSLRLLLPPAVYAVPGHEISIYFDNVILTPCVKNYLFDVDCKAGRQDQERWRYTPEAKDVGSFPFSLKVFDTFDKLVGEASTTVYLSPANAGAGKNISLLIVGDSLTDASVYPKELYKLFKSEGNPNVKFIGSHAGHGSEVKEGVPGHEGRGGWTWNSFCTRWTEEKDKPYRAKSPFLVLKEGKPVLDFKAYCDKYNEGKAPDFITVMLGINDNFGATDETIEKSIDSMFGHADTLLAEFRKVGPNTKIGIVLIPPPAATQDAFGSNYKCGQTRWQYRKNQHRVVERLIQKFAGKEKENLFIIPAYINIDCVNGFPKKQETANSRSSVKISRDSNGVHPAAEGYLQIADSIYYWLKYQLSQEK